MHINTIGASITPYMLSAVEKGSKGISLDSNISLVTRNAQVASEIAVSYAGYAQASPKLSSSHMVHLCV